MLVFSAALAADVVVFGDSWAEGSADELEEVLADMGHAEITVDPQGIGGTTAEYWASIPNALPDAVTANPDARWVWLSIGGNDLFAHYYAGNGANNAADFDAHLRVMLDALYAAHPDIQVVSFGYDFVNFEQSQECILTAWAYFGTSITTQQVNQYFLDDVGGTLAGIAADYPNFTYVDSVWGTLQDAGGVAGAPNVLLPSPAEYMSDCIHPTSEGCTLIHEELVDSYWGYDEPTVAITGPTDACVGESLVLTAAATGATEVAWWIDGVAAGEGATLTVPTSSPGTFSVEVRARAGAWDAADAVEVGVWVAPTPAITGPTAAEVGSAATFQVALAEGETATWSAPGAVVVSDTGEALVVYWERAGDYVVTVDVATPGGCAGGAEAAVTVSGEAGETGVDSGGETGADSGDSADSAGETGQVEDSGAPKDGGCGCAGAGGGGLGGVLVGIAAALARRRR